MALLWNEKYKVGDEKVDAEHREWFRLANDFLVANDRQSRDDSGEAFSRYTRQHFFNEEALMREIQYPSITSHAGEHERLFSTLNKIFDIDVEAILSNIELEEFVGFTLTKHIAAFDAPLSVYIKRRCMAPVM
jgi:hemerythrin-like metal-binding protein